MAAATRHATITERRGAIVEKENARNQELTGGNLLKEAAKRENLQKKLVDKGRGRYDAGGIKELRRKSSSAEADSRQSFFSIERRRRETRRGGLKQ